MQSSDAPIFIDSLDHNDLVRQMNIFTQKFSPVPQRIFHSPRLLRDVTAAIFDWSNEHKLG